MTSVSGAIRQTPRWLIWVGFVLFAMATIAFLARGQWTWFFAGDDVEFELPAAPQLEVRSNDERRFSIDPTQSSASFRVQERLAGIDRETVGTTSSLAGDIVINMADPQRSKIGTIVVNVEVLDSGSTLRDRRIRHDFLESSKHQFVEFVPTVVEGLPDNIESGVIYDIRIRGDLTVKEITASQVFDGTVMLDGEELHASMSTTILMSTYDVGPINIAGLVRTADEVVLELDLVALDTANRQVPAPTAIAAANLTYDPDAPGDFANAVLPILAENCARCHNSGESADGTWALDTAADAAAIAEDLLLITTSRYMPPWPASNKSVDFTGNWSLADHEIAAIADWVAAGGRLDIEPATPISAPEAQLALIDREVVTTSAEPYVGSVEKPDDYRCLINDPQLSETRWLQAYDFEPDRSEIVHHAVVFLANAALREQADHLDAASDQPGWECFVLTGLQETDEGSFDQVLGWAPGRQPVIYEPGTGLRMDSGDFFIVQVHYHYDNATPPDLSRMVLDFADPELVEAAGGSLTAIDNIRYLDPAEIPCSAVEEGPLCDRDASLAKVRDEYGFAAAFIPDFFLSQCGQTAADYAHMTTGVASSSCDLPVEQEGRIVSVFGHLHEIGTAFRMTLNPGTASETVILDIPTWSFEWQLGYTPSEEIVIDRGDTVRIECWWDRSLSTNDEPRYIVWAEGTGDEMCYSAISTVAVNE